MNKRTTILSGVVWEEIAGYSRAVRVGDQVEVAGTAALEGGNVVGTGDIAAQTRFILDRIRKALEEAGTSLEDVVRTRMYLTDIRQWETVARIHGEYFRSIQPATTLVQVSALIHKDLLVEIEASARLSAK